jgi:hypothetical protein
MGESSLHPAQNVQQQGAMRALADIVVDANLSIKHLDCLNQWTTEALPCSDHVASLDALTDAHQLRLQHVGEVLPIRAVAKGLQAIINCSSYGGIQLLLHTVAAIDASLLMLLHSAHGHARQLLQLSDVALHSVGALLRSSSDPKLALAVLIEKHTHDPEISTSFKTRSDFLIDAIVSANALLPFLRTASNAIHCDITKLQENNQIAVFKLCSVAITAQRLIVESQIASSIDCPALHDCFDRGSAVCSEIRQSAIRVIQACNSAKHCDLLQLALGNSDLVGDLLSQDPENAARSSSQYAAQLRLCSSIVRGQLEGCTALHSQAAATLRLAWDIEALLTHGHLMLMKKLSHASEQTLRQACAASADMLESDCELHGVDLGESSPSSWPPLLRKCSGYGTVLHIIRNGHKDLPHRSSSSETDASKHRHLSLLYCVENRESRVQPGSRPLIDITDIRFPSPRRLYEFARPCCLVFSI